jgi:hypothetical protein
MNFWKATVWVTMAVALILGGAKAEVRADFNYTLDINTSSFSGSTGYLDIQFNPTTPLYANGGTGTLTATVNTLSSTDAILGPPYYSSGNVTGPGTTIPGQSLAFTADNRSSGPLVNEFTQAVIYGNTIALAVTITTSDAISPASFMVTVYDSNFNSLSAISSPTNLATIELDLVPNPGGTIPTANPPLLGPGANAIPAIAVPEPSLEILLAQAIACLGGYGMIRRKWLPVVVK